MIVFSRYSKHEEMIKVNEQIHQKVEYPNICKDILYDIQKKKLEEILGASNIYDFKYEGYHEHKYIYHIKYIKEIKSQVD